MSMDGEHKPAFRMLYYWTQINDMVRTALICWVRLQGPVIHAKGRLIFEDDLRSGGLHYTVNQRTLWSLWGNQGMARCREMSTLHAGYIPQRKVTSASSSGSLGLIMNFHCVWSVAGWLIVYQDGNYLYPGQYSQTIFLSKIKMIPPLEQEHQCGKTQCIPGMQVLVKSWLRKTKKRNSFDCIEFFWEGHKIWRNLHLKMLILWPYQNMWTKDILTYVLIKLKIKICTYVQYFFQAATVDKLAKVLKECEEFDALKVLTPTSLQNT